jgi:hypothetical protein
MASRPDVVILLLTLTPGDFRETHRGKSLPETLEFGAAFLKLSFINFFRVSRFGLVMIIHCTLNQAHLALYCEKVNRLSHQLLLKVHQQVG